MLMSEVKEEFTARSSFRGGGNETFGIIIAQACLVTGVVSSEGTFLFERLAAVLIFADACCHGMSIYQENLIARHGGMNA